MKVHNIFNDTLATIINSNNNYNGIKIDRKIRYFAIEDNGERAEIFEPSEWKDKYTNGGKQYDNYDFWKFSAQIHNYYDQTLKETKTKKIIKWIRSIFIETVSEAISKSIKSML